MTKANEYIKYLQKYEKAAEKIIEIFDGEENYDFLSIWFDEKQIEDLAKENNKKISDILQERNNVYLEVIKLFNFLKKDK